MNKLHLFVASLLLLPALDCAMAGPAEVICDAAADYVYNDNLSHGRRDQDIRADSSFGLTTHVGAFRLLNEHLRVALTADLGARQFLQYGDFNRIDGGLTASARYRFGLGAMAPDLRLELSAGYSGFEEDLFSGWNYRTRLTFSKRLSDRFQTSLFYAFEANTAREDVFEAKGHNLGVNLSYDFTSTTRLSLGYVFRHGNALSFANPRNPEVRALADHLLPVTTFGDPFTAYRLEANTHVISVGISQGLTRRVSLDVRYQWEETLRDHLSYHSDVLTAAVIVTF